MEFAYIEYNLPEPLHPVSIRLETKVASGSETGPGIENFGPVFTAPGDSCNLKPDQRHKIIKNVGKGPDDPADINCNKELIDHCMVQVCTSLFVDKQPATLVTWKKILYTELTWPFQP